MVKYQRKLSKQLRPNKDRANTLVITFKAMVVLNLLAGINSILLYTNYSGASFGALRKIQDSPGLVFLMLFAGLTLIMFVVAIINFLNWFRRAYYNLHLFADKKPSYDEDMAVWSFMIPFINLVRPFTIATEIYDGNHSKASELTDKPLPKNDSIISIWWMAFVILGILISILSQVGGEENIQQIIDGMLYLGIAELLGIPRLITAIYMVKEVSKVESIVYKNRLGLDEPELLNSLSEEE